jgi:hypothetical protein
MTPGAIKEAGKIAIGTVEALKSQPIVLALIVLQLMVLAAVLYSSMHRQNAISQQFKHVYDLLEQCLKRGL